MSYCQNNVEKYQTNETVQVIWLDGFKNTITKKWWFITAVVVADRTSVSYASSALSEQDASYSRLLAILSSRQLSKQDSDWNCRVSVRFFDNVSAFD
jgi:hypothetical protein